MRPDYIYNHKRHDQLRVNLALLKAAFQKNKWKARLGLMAGDYSKQNLAAEPDLTNIREVSGFSSNFDWTIITNIL